MKRIAVLMTCFNRVKTTLECLERLFAQEIPEEYQLDVWLVDDASPDETGRHVKEAFPMVNVVEGLGNLFWCKGMRLAWDKAAEANDYDFYLWLNDDTHLVPNAIATAIADYDKIVALGMPESVVYGTFTAEANTDFISYGCRKVSESEIVAPTGEPIEIDGDTTGNFVLISRSAYQKAGKMYGGYSHGFADFDYGLTLGEKGCHKFIASKILGWCKPNYGITESKLRDMSLWKRIKLLWSPKGYNIHDAFIYRLRHWGVMRACLTAAHVLYIVVFAKDVKVEKKYEGS